MAFPVSESTLWTWDLIRRWCNTAKKEFYDQTEIAKLVEEKRKEYEQSHIAKIEMKYGNTYISFGVRDCITSQYFNILKGLLGLMGEEISMHVPFDTREGFYLILKDENADRAAFIQKFIDNRYKLSWK